MQEDRSQLERRRDHRGCPDHAFLGLVDGRVALELAGDVLLELGRLFRLGRSGVELKVKVRRRFVLELFEDGFLGGLNRGSQGGLGGVKRIEPGLGVGAKQGHCAGSTRSW